MAQLSWPPTGEAQCGNDVFGMADEVVRTRNVFENVVAVGVDGQRTRPK